LYFDYPWRRVRAQAGTIDCRRLTDRLSNLSELIAVYVCVWESKVRVIEEVEEPCSDRELGLLPLRHSEGILYIEVRVEVTRTTKLVPALGADTALRRTTLLQRDPCGCEREVVSLRTS